MGPGFTAPRLAHEHGCVPREPGKREPMGPRLESLFEGRQCLRRDRLELLRHVLSNHVECAVEAGNRLEVPVDVVVDDEVVLQHERGQPRELPRPRAQLRVAQRRHRQGISTARPAPCELVLNPHRFDFRVDVVLEHQSPLDRRRADETRIIGRREMDSYRSGIPLPEEGRPEWGQEQQ